MVAYFGFHVAAGETMISGYTGEAFRTDIFIGPVYYQRLRHMVSDKFQVCPHILSDCSLHQVAKVMASFASLQPYSNTIRSDLHGLSNLRMLHFVFVRLGSVC